MKVAAASLLLCLSLVTVGCGDSSEAISVQSGAEASKRSRPEIEKPDGQAPKTLIVKDLIRGSGKPAKKGDDVIIEYLGVSYTSGKEYSDSWGWDYPSLFELGPKEVIPGWEKGLQGMRVGGRRELIVPESMLIPGGGPPGPEAVVFVIDLLAVS
jgi:peptidylprolyl isomerase